MISQLDLALALAFFPFDPIRSNSIYLYCLGFVLLIIINTIDSSIDGTRAVTAAAAVVVVVAAVAAEVNSIRLQKL